FEGFQQAVSQNAYLSVVDRAANLAEGILGYCLTCVSMKVPKTLNDRLQEARKVLDDPQRPTNFPLNEYGFHIAHRIRLLHQRLHEDKAVGQGRAVRPEVGMSASIDVSELL